LRGAMHDGDMNAIRRFRELHVAGIALNFTQLAAFVWVMMQVKF
jgi:hypothetical protein